MFVTRLILSVFNVDEWVVESPLVWYSLTDGRREVPTGFITDLASIPPPLRVVLDVNGKSRKGAVLHDWLYCSQILPRVEADKLFYDALVSEGMSRALANVYWLGVRAGGWSHYKKCGGIAINDFVSKEAFESAKVALVS